PTGGGGRGGAGEQDADRRDIGARRGNVGPPRSGRRSRCCRAEAVTVMPEPGTEPGTGADTGAPHALHLHGWTSRAVIGVALAAFASGFGQFGLVAALGDVARDFGRVTHGLSIADQVGLSGTELGIGLAIIRLASLGSLPLIGLADRY